MQVDISLSNSFSMLLESVIHITLRLFDLETVVVSSRDRVTIPDLHDKVS